MTAIWILLNNFLIHLIVIVLLGSHKSPKIQTQNHYNYWNLLLRRMNAEFSRDSPKVLLFIFKKAKTQSLFRSLYNSQIYIVSNRFSGPHWCHSKQEVLIVSFLSSHWLLEDFSYSYTQRKIIPRVALLWIQRMMVGMDKYKVLWV